MASDWPLARLVRHSLGMNKPQLAVVVPAFNEAHRLNDNLLALLQLSCRPTVRRGADRGRRRLDRRDRASGGGIFRPRSEVPGARPAFRAESRQRPRRPRRPARAQAPIALFSDADLSTPFTELPKIVEPIEAGNYDLVFGSRALDRSLIGHRQPWRREQGGKVFNAHRPPNDRTSLLRHPVRFQSLPHGSGAPDHRAGADRWLRLRRRIALSRAARRIAHAGAAGALGSQRGQQSAYRARQFAHVRRNRELAHARRARAPARRRRP